MYPDGQAAVDKIVTSSKAWNGSVGITGALVFSELHFVQFIEGPGEAIEDLLAKLRADSHHTNIKIIDERQATERFFGKWSLAYAGHDAFIDQRLIPTLQNLAPDLRRGVAENLRSQLVSMAENA